MTGEVILTYAKSRGLHRDSFVIVIRI